jgi:hypothetical protein
MEEVIIKLNKCDRELQQELDVRRCIASTPVQRLRVRARHPSVVSIPSSPGASAAESWHTIFLEKGIVDLHRLCDAMSQGATQSRLREAGWKLDVLRRLVSIVVALQQRGLVWYDLKPSNFIVFPPLSEEKEKESAREKSSTVPEIAAAAASVTELSCADRAACSSQWGTKAHLWLQRCQWGAEDFILKATDLSSVFPAGSKVRKELISCTARYMCPALARAMQDSAVAEITVEPAHMLWALGMSALQLLQCESKTFYAHTGAAHSQEVFAFLGQADEVVQRSVDGYAESLVRAELQGEVGQGRGTEMGKVENEEVEEVLRMVLSLLRVKDSDRSMELKS